MLYIPLAHQLGLYNIKSEMEDIYFKFADPEQYRSIKNKLDFLVQELNREVNTLSSKSQDVPITQLVVSMKAEIEKLREQLQNIE